MESQRKSLVKYDNDDLARRDYFYDMLDQLLLIGRQAGGQAAIDALLIKGLIDSRHQDAKRSA